MAQALTPGLTVARRVYLRRRRELPLPGTITVRRRDTVSPDTVVGRTELPGDLYILRVAEQLGIEPFEVVRGLRVAEGDKVGEGQVLCEHAGLFGLFRSRIAAPAEGTIEFISDKIGHVGLRLPARPIEINAYIPGVVVDVEEGKAVVVEGQGAFIQGIFGVGGERQGRLHTVACSPGDTIGVDQLPSSCRGLVLAGGASVTYEAVARAAEEGAVGLVTGSLDDAVLARYLGYELGIAVTGDEEVPLTIVLTEGFGNIPMAPDTASLLNELTGAAVSVNGATQVRAGAVRPEVFVHAHTEGVAAAAGSTGLTVGARIRIIRVPHFGVEAVVAELPHEPARLETGTLARVLKARLDDGSVVTVPRANVELR